MKELSLNDWTGGSVAVLGATGEEDAVSCLASSIRGAHRESRRAAHQTPLWPIRLRTGQPADKREGDRIRQKPPQAEQSLTNVPSRTFQPPPAAFSSVYLENDLRCQPEEYGIEKKQKWRNV